MPSQERSASGIAGTCTTLPRGPIMTSRTLSFHGISQHFRPPPSEAKSLLNPYASNPALVATAHQSLNHRFTPYPAITHPSPNHNHPPPDAYRPFTSNAPAESPARRTPLPCRKYVTAAPEVKHGEVRPGRVSAEERQRHARTRRSATPDGLLQFVVSGDNISCRNHVGRPPGRNELAAVVESACLA